MGDVHIMGKEAGKEKILYLPPTGPVVEETESPEAQQDFK